MTYLVILGAGEDQLATYHEARCRGLRTVGVDMRADAPGAVLADTFLHVTTRDAETLASLLRDVPVAGVIAPAGDAAQPTVRALSLALGLAPIVSDEAARCSSDKGAFRRAVAAAGLPTYRSEQHAGEAELEAAARHIGFPVMVKPSDSSGSKGVSYVIHRDGMAEAVAEARRFSVTGQVIVEQYVEGRHVAAECFLSGGELALCVLSERTTTGPPAMITVTHHAPAPLSERETSAVRGAIASVARAVGLADGPLNVDVIVTPAGTPYLVEMGARLGGNGMPQLVSLVHGVDTVAAAVSHACGLPFDVRPRHTHHAVLHILHTDRGGTLARLRGVDVVARCPEVVAHELFVAPGDEVRPYVKAANKLGYVLLSGPRPGVLAARLARIEAAFGVDLEPAPVPPTPLDSPVRHVDTPTGVAP